MGIWEQIICKDEMLKLSDIQDAPPRLKKGRFSGAAGGVMD